MGAIKKVLIVEDQEMNRKILSRILSDSYEVLEAENGSRALEVLERYGEEISLLHLEITESVYTESPQQIMETVRRLRQLGFVIEMDDFGSGYFSLNMLYNCL